VIRRGDIWWANFSSPRGSGPGYRRPVLVVQANAFNESRIQTVIAAVISSNVDLAAAPGNVLLGRRDSKLPRESVVNVSQLVTLNKSFLTERVGRLSDRHLYAVAEGLRLALSI
jgi:mRNA interferase MazF